MPLVQTRNVNFGTRRSGMTGSTGVGYTIFAADGSIFQARTTTGVYEIMSGSGCYAASMSFPTNFHGNVAWDTGSGSFAVEQYNEEENNPVVYAITGTLAQLSGTMSVMSGQVQFLYDMEGGRWKLNAATNQMLFYASDNTTLIATFNLFDISGAPTIDQVAERQRV